MAKTNFKIVGIVGWGHLHAARAKFQIHILVGYDGDLTIHQGEQALLADDVLIPPVGGTDRHTGIPKHGLRPGGGYHDITARLTHNGILDVPQMAGFIPILYLCVG